MQLTTKVRYAARAMAELGANYPAETVSSRNLAKTLRVSEKYLETILRSAKRRELVKATRGAQGGFTLARRPDRITLLDVYTAVEGKLTLTECLDKPNGCPLATLCPTRDTWTEIRDAITAVLERTTVQDLVERGIEKSRVSAPMYHI